MVASYKYIKILLSYAITVFVIEYFLFFFVTLQITTDTTVQDVQNPIGKLDLRQLNKTFRHAFLASKQTDGNVSKLLEVQTHLDWNRTELLLVQLRLSACVEANRGYLYTCFEDEYIRQRKTFIHTDKKPNASDQAQKPKSAPGIKGVSPTDDPKEIVRYYQKRPNIVSPYPYTFETLPKQKCDNETLMVVLVHSYHPYEDRRQAIRKTWGDVIKGKQLWPGSSKQLPAKMAFFFIFGSHQDPDYNNKVRKEAEEYDDVITGNFFDDYFNMTLKSLLGLRFVADYCQHTKYLLKSDDDMLINVPYLWDILNKKNPERSIMGPMNRHSPVFRGGKWKIENSVFPFHRYPVYESGSAYVITTDIVSELYDTALYMPRIHVDDAYITGILGKVIGVNHVMQGGFAYWGEKVATVCDFLKRKKVTATKMTPERLLYTWKQFGSPNISQTCR